MKTKTKPKRFAPWLDTPRGYDYRVAQAAKAAEKARLKAARKAAKPKRRVKPVSAARSASLKEYANKRAEFLAGATCRCCAVAKATDVHHKRGRAGKLLCDCRHWLPLCRRCHEWVGRNPETARHLGLLCKKGEWGKQ